MLIFLEKLTKYLFTYYWQLTIKLGHKACQRRFCPNLTESLHELKREQFSVKDYFVFVIINYFFFYPGTVPMCLIKLVLDDLHRKMAGDCSKYYESKCNGNKLIDRISSSLT